MIARLRKQKLRLEETRDTLVWDHVGESTGRSSTLGAYDEKVPLRDGESKCGLQSMLFVTWLTRTLILDYEKFQKPQAAGRLSDYVMTSQLNGALEHIGQAIEEAVDLPNDAFSSIHRQLVESQNIISYVIRCMEYDEDSEAESSL